MLGKPPHYCSKLCSAPIPASPTLVLLSAVIGTTFLVHPVAPSLAFQSTAAWSRAYLFAQTDQQNRLSGAGELRNTATNTNKYTIVPCLAEHKA